MPCSHFWQTASDLETPRLVQRRLTHDAGYIAAQQIPGIGPALAAVLVAEIGDVHRFDGPAQLTC
jgi:transposase